MPEMAEELLTSVRARLAQAEWKVRQKEVGWITRVGDGVAYLRGAPSTRYGELLAHGDGLTALAFELQPREIGALFLDSSQHVSAGDELRPTGRVASVMVGEPVLGRVVDALGRPLDLVLLPSSGHYIGGEETASLEWVEGRFPFPRGKPPYPAQSGVHGCPTLINNVETLANVPHIAVNGAAWFRALGHAPGTGTKLYSLSGDVLYPGVFELPMGTPLRELIFVHGGGLLSKKPLKAVFTGGPSNTLLTPADLDVAMDFDSLHACGSSLGTGAMIVISEGTGIVKRVAEYERFFAHSSCGQCPSCKTGTATISRLLDLIDTGCGTAADLNTLKNLCAMLPDSGRCHLVNGAVKLLDSAFHHFADEFSQALR